MSDAIFMAFAIAGLVSSIDKRLANLEAKVDVLLEIEPVLRAHTRIIDECIEDGSINILRAAQILAEEKHIDAGTREEQLAAAMRGPPAGSA